MYIYIFCFYLLFICTGICLTKINIFIYSKEADAAFDKYTQNFVRRLHKPKAVEMFENEYKLTTDEANTVFEIFDKDYNGELSYWEYKQFYLTVGEK